ncbi:MAG: hypothetical protein KAT48_09720 [Bacteroidales bacterium]|nr:hypothetical protein [Bacteroidales bacterium]
MKNSNLIATLLLLLFFVTSNAFSQGYFSMHFGPSFPMSDFADDDMYDEDAGGAGVGFGLGLQYVHPLTESGLGLFCGFDFNYNGLKKDVKDDIEDMFPNNADITYYKYLNYPVSAGLNYTYQTDGNTSFIGNIGLTANFLKTTDFVVEVDNEEVSIEFDLANSIGFKIGGGILLNDKTLIEINYLGLGKHDIEGKMKYDGGSEDIDDIEQEVTILTLTIGFKF